MAARGAGGLFDVGQGEDVHRIRIGHIGAPDAVDVGRADGHRGVEVRRDAGDAGPAGDQHPAVGGGQAGDGVRRRGVEELADGGGRGVGGGGPRRGPGPPGAEHLSAAAGGQHRGGGGGGLIGNRAGTAAGEVGGRGGGAGDRAFKGGGLDGAGHIQLLTGGGRADAEITGARQDDFGDRIPVVNRQEGGIAVGGQAGGVGT